MFGSGDVPIEVLVRNSSQPVRVIVTHENEEGNFDNASLARMKVLYVIQIIVGIICMILGIVLLAVDYSTSNTHLFGKVSYGIWNGSVFAVVGCVGKRAVKKNTYGWITGTLFVNIFCPAYFGVALKTLASVDIIYTTIDDCSSECEKNYVYLIHYSFDSLLLVMSITHLIVCIWCAALCCGAVCICYKVMVGNRVVQYKGTLKQNVPLPIRELMASSANSSNQRQVSVHDQTEKMQTYDPPNYSRSFPPPYEACMEWGTSEISQGYAADR